RDYASVRKHLQTEVALLLVDEFQDTSRQQWELLELLTGGDTRKFFLVGDPKQSIYSFRYAEVALFEQAKEKVLSQGGLSLVLSHNFRSSPTLIEHINRFSKSLFPEGFTPMRSADDSGCLTDALYIL